MTPIRKLIMLKRHLPFFRLKHFKVAFQALFIKYYVQHMITKRHLAHIREKYRPIQFLSEMRK
jgi:hypothetical protein